jgi:hypothetical protein
MEALLGDQLIIDLGVRAVSIAVDEPGAVISTSELVTVTIEPSSQVVGPCRVLVELRRFHGGLAPHVILGAGYRPGGDTLIANVATGVVDGARRTCRSRLGRRKLIPGLPAELAESVVGGLVRSVDLGAGVITVDRAAFDPVETSPLIVELAAEILGKVLSSAVSADLSESQVRRWLESLP